MSIVGPMVDPGDIERAVLETLKKWLPYYLKAKVKADDLPANYFAQIRTWGVSSEYREFPEQRLPALIVAAPGLLEPPTKDGEGLYRGTYPVEISITVDGENGAKVRERAQKYNAAILAAILQRRSLGDEMRVTDWIDDGYGDLPPGQPRRSRIVAMNVFHVQRQNLVSTDGGPATEEPPDEVLDESPEITDVDVDVEPQDKPEPEDEP